MGRDGLGSDLDPLPALNSSYRFGPWFATEQHMLGLLFWRRLQGHECVTSNWKRADIFYVPALLGLHSVLRPRTFDFSALDALGDELEAFLRYQPGFMRSRGADHFVVLGQQIWDYARRGRNSSSEQWGSYLISRPAFRDVTFVSIESISWMPTTRSVPYPTAFHPVDRGELDEWVAFVRGHERPLLATLLAGPRKQSPERTAVVEACRAADDGNCTYVDCSKDCPSYFCASPKGFCGDPRQVASIYLSSTFCLQPRGDSHTRRSTFDAILAGCIPVFFDRSSIDGQYVWNLPGNRSEMSVVIQGEGVLKGEVDFLEELWKLPGAEVRRMRERVIELIPRVVICDHTRPVPRAEVFEDAIDVAMEGIQAHIRAAKYRLLHRS